MLFDKEYRRLMESFDTVSDFMINPEHSDKEYGEIFKEFKKSGGKNIGYGAFGMVYYHPKWPYVLKTFKSDDAYLKFVRYAYDNSHPSFPKFYGKPQRVSPKIQSIKDKRYLVRIEKLKPISAKVFRKIDFKLADFFKLIHKPDEVSDDERRKLLNMQNDLRKVSKSVYKLLEGWYLIKSNLGLQGDLHDGNVMVRGDGQFVLVDPVKEEGEISEMENSLMTPESFHILYQMIDKINRKFKNSEVYLERHDDNFFDIQVYLSLDISKCGIKNVDVLLDNEEEIKELFEDGGELYFNVDNIKFSTADIKVELTVKNMGTMNNMRDGVTYLEFIPDYLNWMYQEFQSELCDILSEMSGNIQESTLFDREYRKLMLEFSEGAIRKFIQKFQNDASEEEIRREVQDFEKYKQGLQKKDPLQYKSWIEFTEAIHAAKGKSEFKKKKAPTQDVVANQEDIVADDENVTIYRGDSQDKCVLYGKGYTFCISRQAGGNMFSNYRLGKESTFYFIYFKKKPKTEKDHIMVLDHTNKGYEWTFADNATREVKGGWQEIVSKYPELGRYENLLVNKKLDDEERGFIKKLTNFINNPTLERFNQFSYKQKAQALKSVINLSDEIWKTLDSVLRNEFLSIGPNLTNYQADDLKSNEIERYKKTRALSFDQLGTKFIINKCDSVNIKDKFIKRVASTSSSAYQYARDVLRGKNVPDLVIKSIASHTPFAYNYALLTLKNENVPDVIIKSIASDIRYAYAYAVDGLDWQNVPKEIIKSIQNSGKYIPPKTTIQESFQFDKEYRKIFTELTSSKVVVR